VGLRNGSGWSEEDFRSLLCDIHRSHYAKLVGLASIWVDAAGEDAVQDAYLHVWSSWERIRDAEKVLLYLRRAVVNNAMDELRHRRVTRRLLPGLSTPPTGNEDAGRPLWSRRPEATEDEALGHVADEAIVLCVRGLAPQQSACVALRFYLDLSEKEIADVRNISTGAVKVHISRAKERLRKLLEANGD
jgi:RNA polymerase sigma factor (sigma-70 family)